MLEAHRLVELVQHWGDNIASSNSNVKGLVISSFRSASQLH